MVARNPGLGSRQRCVAWLRESSAGVRGQLASGNLKRKSSPPVIALSSNCWRNSRLGPQMNPVGSSVECQVSRAEGERRPKPPPDAKRRSGGQNSRSPGAQASQAHVHSPRRTGKHERWHPRRSPARGFCSSLTRTPVRGATCLMRFPTISRPTCREEGRKHITGRHGEACFQIRNGPWRRWERRDGIGRPGLRVRNSCAE